MHSQVLAKLLSQHCPQKTKTYKIMTKKLTLLFFICILSALNINAEVYEGSCGENVSYSLDTSTGLLSITGTGAMTDYSYSSSAPWYSNKSYIKVVEISDGVTSIGNLAFYECSRLTTVTIPNSVTSIGRNAFFNTQWYKNQSDGLIYIGMVAYKYKGTMPNNTSIIIKDGTTSIGSNAFDSCKGLTSVTIPNSVTSIGEYAFAYCYGLTSVTIPNSVTSIGSDAFYGTAWYNNQPNGLVYAGLVAYKYKGTMPENTSIIINEGILGIAGGAFNGCSGLTSVTIPNSVTSIGTQAFYKCSGLTAINIPNSVTSIGGNAFAYCYGLTSVTIPNSVTSIANGAFENCSGLTSLIIPNSVTSINRAAFHDCYRLTSVTCEATSVPATESDAFSNVSSATLYVPASALEDYKATAPWSGFGTIKAIGDVPVTEKCATPTISYVDGKLTFSCDTEGATCQYSITDTDIKAGSGNEVQLTTTYKVTVYATKDGYENSDEATLEINVSGGTSGIRGDLNGDGVVNMPDAMFIVNKILNGKFPDE